MISQLNPYCLSPSCGVDGNAVMSGAIGFRVCESGLGTIERAVLIDDPLAVPPNLSAANVKIGGRFHAGIGLGLTPNSTFTKEISKRVVRIGDA